MISSNWMRGAVAVLSTSVLAAGCAGNPAPGESGYRYNLNGTYEAVFESQGTNYTGTMALTTAPGGVVTGSVILTSPAEVIGDVTGTVVDSTFQFESDYSRDGGCSGTLIGTGVIQSDGIGTSGTIEIADDCTGGIMEGTFDLSRAAER
jgi:hypothetical protein